jgi:tetratricopeptide (TPR) repeat protein
MDRVFLSCVTDEFGSYRLVLAADILRPGVEVETQEKFIAYGAETLLKLDECIAECKAVIHIAGDLTGSVASEANRKAILDRYSYEKLAELGLDQATVDRLTYTQWEAWLAILHRKKLYLCTPSEEARRDQPPVYTPAGEQQRSAQKRHLELLREKGRYEESPLRFPDANRLSVEILRALHHILPPVHLRISEIPSSLHHLFKGRDEWLARIRASLLATSHSSIDARRVVLWGAGGFGKTRLAVEYAHLFAGRYTALLMVKATTEEDLRNNIADLATCFDLPQSQTADVKVRYDAVLRWFRSDANRGWLLIVDNVDTDSSFHAATKLVEQLHFGHIILTGRKRDDWPASVNELHIDKLSLEASTSYLLEATQGKRVPESGDPADDERMAEKLASLLDGLALALVQAAGAIKKRAISFADYLTDWEHHHAEILNDPDFSPTQTGYPRTLAATWKTSYEQLPEDSRIIFDLLCWLAPDPIPESLITEEWPEVAAVLMPPKFATMDERGRSRLLLPLYHYCLAEQPTDKNRCLEIHRIIQSVGRTYLQKRQESDQLRNAAAGLVEARYVSEQHLALAEHFLSTLRLLAPHVRFLVQKTTDNLTSLVCCRLMMVLSRQYCAEGFLIEAEQGAEYSLQHGRNAASEPDNVSAAIALARSLCLAIWIKNSVGNHTEARKRCEEVLTLTASWNTANDLERCRCYAYALCETSRTWQLAGTLDKASEFAVLSLDAAERSCRLFPTDALFDRDLGIAKEVLGHVRQSQGQLDEALSLLDQCRKIRETLREREPGNLAYQRELGSALENLGRVQESQGQLGEAFSLFDQSRKIRESLCEREPGNLAHQRELEIGIENVGRVRESQGQLGEALSLFDQSRKIRETLCEREPGNMARQRELAIALNNAGRVRGRQGQLDKASSLFDQSRRICETLCEREPGNLAHQRGLGIALDNVARVHEKKGELDEALSLFDQIREIRERQCEGEPGNLAHQRELGIALLNVSRVLAMLKRKKQAVTTADKAEKIFKDLIAQNASFGDTKHHLKIAQSLIQFARKQGY